MRIAFMVMKLLLFIPYYMIRMSWMGKHSSKEKTFAFIKHCAIRANKAGIPISFWKTESYAVIISAFRC